VAGAGQRVAPGGVGAFGLEALGGALVVLEVVDAPFFDERMKKIHYFLLENEQEKESIKWPQLASNASFPPENCIYQILKRFIP
jgi:hypothetical protein